MTDQPPIDGAALLDEVEAFHRRFNVFPTEAAYVAVALWDAHAHLLDCFDSTPRMAFLSPEPGSGKSRALEIVETLVPRPMVAVNASAAALFRVGVRTATDGPRSSSTRSTPSSAPRPETTRNCAASSTPDTAAPGSPTGASATEPTRQCRPFPSYTAVAVAGLGSLPDTILTRSVIIRMRRRARNEKVEPFRARLHEKEGNALRDRLAKWAEHVRELVTDAWPEMPDGVTDRPADVWEPLLAVADAAGGDWPDGPAQPA